MRGLDILWDPDRVGWGTELLRLTDRRQAHDRFLFERLDSGFQAEVEVDGDGLVLDYPGLFRRPV